MELNVVCVVKGKSNRLGCSEGSSRLTDSPNARPKAIFGNYTHFIAVDAFGWGCPRSPFVMEPCLGPLRHPPMNTTQRYIEVNAEAKRKVVEI